MIQEDKELSFIDISGRLHYGVLVNYKENEYDHRKWKITTLHTLSYSKSGTLIDTDFDGWISYEEHEGCGMSTGSRPFRFGEVLPYLRTMSSMTEEEKHELLRFGVVNLDRDNNATDVCCVGFGNHAKVQDYLNSIHVDYRGLIPKGLAIEVTEENNPYKDKL